MAYDDNSSPVRDLNALASFSNIEEVNEDDNHLVQILYQKVDDSIEAPSNNLNYGGGNCSPRGMVKGLVAMANQQYSMAIPRPEHRIGATTYYKLDK